MKRKKESDTPTAKARWSVRFRIPFLDFDIKQGAYYEWNTKTQRYEIKECMSYVYRSNANMKHAYLYCATTGVIKCFRDFLLEVGFILDVEDMKCQVLM